MKTYIIETSSHVFYYLLGDNIRDCLLNIKAEILESIISIELMNDSHAQMDIYPISLYDSDKQQFNLTQSPF